MSHEATDDAGTDHREPDTYYLLLPKAGFREVGLFNAGKPTESYDMMLELG